MADLATDNPMGRTVGQATTVVVSPCGGGGLPDLAPLLDERRALLDDLFVRRARRMKMHDLLVRLDQIAGIVGPIAAENGLCVTCFEDLADQPGPVCEICDEVPF